MKKKLISLLLAALLVAALLPVSAFAEPAVVVYALGSGDTVATLCQKHGVDYKQYRELLMALNTISNENEFANMAVGSHIVIPVSANAAASLANLGRAGVIPGSAGTGASAPVSAPAGVGQAKDIVSGDAISCYVVSYTVKSGDTIINLYKSRNLDYKTFSNLILKLNKLSNFNNLKVGQTLLLPVTNLTGNDNVVYTIMSHTMKSGETVYGIVNGGYGMNYNANLDMLKTINAKDDLTRIKVGETLNIAVSGLIHPSTLQQK